MTCATTLVHWLNAGDPPAELAAHLKTQGLVLGPAGSGTPCFAARLAGTIETAPVLPPSLTGRRVAVLHPDPGGADRLAQAMRKRGATVSVLSLDPRALEHFDLMGPDAVLVEPSHFTGSCWQIVRALWAHPLLRWAPIVVTPSASRTGSTSRTSDDDRICQSITRLSADYEVLRQKAAEGGPFEGSLARLGPARSLLAFMASGAALRVKFEMTGCTIEVDIADKLVKGARQVEEKPSGATLLGHKALSRVLTAEEARMFVGRGRAPALTNLMVPLEAALRLPEESLDRALPSDVAQSSIRPSAVDRDMIPTVRPPKPPVPSLGGLPQVSLKSTNSARVYPFPALLPAPASPVGGGAQASARAVQTFRSAAVERASVMACAAALDLSSQPEWDASFLESVRKQSMTNLVLVPLHSGIVEISDPYGRGLVEEEQDPASGGTANVESQGKLGFFKSKVSLLAFLRSQVERRKLWIPGLALLFIGLLLYSHAGSERSSLRIRVSKLPPKAAVAQPAVESEIVEPPLDPKKPRARQASELVSRGHALRHEGKLAQAEQLYRRALQVFPAYPRALTGLARTAMERGDAETAIRFARMLVRVRPRQGASHLLLGDAYRAAGNSAAALSAFKAAAKRGDRVAKSRLKLASGRAVSAKVTY